jgi:phage-related protein
VSWTVTFYDTDVESEILDLPTGLLARFVRYAERMEEHGPDLGMPHTRAMGAGLFELRLKAGEGIARVFYCTIVDRRIVMLHHFVKKSQKTPYKELEIARRRLEKVKRGW